MVKKTYVKFKKAPVKFEKELVDGVKDLDDLLKNKKDTKQFKNKFKKKFSNVIDIVGKNVDVKNKPKYKQKDKKLLDYLKMLPNVLLAITVLAVKNMQLIDIVSKAYFVYLDIPYETPEATPEATPSTPSPLPKFSPFKGNWSDSVDGLEPSKDDWAQPEQPSEKINMKKYKTNLKNIVEAFARVFKSYSILSKTLLGVTLVNLFMNDLPSFVDSIKFTENLPFFELLKRTINNLVSGERTVDAAGRKSRYL